MARHVLSRLHDAGGGRAAHEARARIQRLSPRQRELLGLLARGLTNAEIAATLHLSEGTVNAYLRELFGRLDVRNRVEAAVVAHRADAVGAPTPGGPGRGSVRG